MLDRAPEFNLRTTPPRIGKSFVARARLSLSSPTLRDHQILILEASAGFGKTALLSQWRREWLRQGVVVGWLSLDERDESEQLVDALRQSLRVAGLKTPNPVPHADAFVPASDAFSSATAWLSELALWRSPVALILDDFHALVRPESKELLTYIVRNAPENLSIAIASRSAASLAFADFAGDLSVVTIKNDALRLTPKESADILAARSGDPLDADLVARLHDSCAGWSLGLLLMSSAIEHGATPRATLRVASDAKHEVERYLTAFLLDRLPPEALNLLLRLSLLDSIGPALCAAVTNDENSPSQLDRLRHLAPVFSEAAESDWIKLHSLVGEFLRAHALETLPTRDIDAVHTRAARWFAEQGMDEQAARHALAAGDEEMAYGLIERALHPMALKGHYGLVRNWLDRLPPREIASRPRLAISFAIEAGGSDRNARARDLLGALMKDPDLSPSLNLEVMLASVSVEICADNIDNADALCSTLLQRVLDTAPQLERRISGHRAAILTYTGHPHLARAIFGTEYRPPGVLSPAEQVGLAELYRAWLICGSHTWEGRPGLALDSLGTLLERADLLLGRRNATVTMLAVFVAEAECELGHLDSASAHLADRLDVVEDFARPRGVVVAFRTAARIAEAAGKSNKCIDLLESMVSMAEQRHWPRVTLDAVAELIRVHSQAGRVRIGSQLLARAAAAHEAAVLQNPNTLTRLLDLRLLMCRAYASAGSDDLLGAQSHAEAAEARAVELRCAREQIQMQLLQVRIWRHAGRETSKLLAEALSLAEMLGLKQIVAESGLVDDASPVTRKRSLPPAQPNALVRTNPVKAAVTSSAMLTPKEREILDLLSRGLQNKQIAAATDVGTETVKWHLKNLMTKLDAANRQHAISRARVLGLIDSD